MPAIFAPKWGKCRLYNEHGDGAIDPTQCFHGGLIDEQNMLPGVN